MFLFYRFPSQAFSVWLYYRANAALPMMGLTSTGIEGKVRQDDVMVGKNYLSEKEIAQLKLIVEQFLAYAESQALDEKPMSMRDWIEKLSLILTMNGKNILECHGRVSRALAEDKAKKEYSAYKKKLKEHEHLESIKELDRDIKALAANSKRGKPIRKKIPNNPSLAHAP